MLESLFERRLQMICPLNLLRLHSCHHARIGEPELRATSQLVTKRSGQPWLFSHASLELSNRTLSARDNGRLCVALRGISWLIGDAESDARSGVAMLSVVPVLAGRDMRFSVPPA